MATYSNKNLLYVIIRNLFFVLVLVALYQYVYKDYENQLNEKILLRERYQGVNSDLEKFPESNHAMAETKLQIEEVITSIPLNYVPNQDLLTGYRDRVVAVAEEYSIKVSSENVVRDQSDMVTLTLGFKAKYEPLFKFLFSIETFSTVSSFSVDKDGNVEVKSSPILYSAVVDDFFSGRTEVMDDVRASGYFKEIFKKSIDTVNNVGHIPTWRDIDPAPQDPFYEYIPPKERGLSKKDRVLRRKPPPIEISGIIFDASNPMVIIDGVIHRKGDFYKPRDPKEPAVKIISIQERTIIVELDGQKYIIKFNKEE
jgi:hypothetical protein